MTRRAVLIAAAGAMAGFLAVETVARLGGLALPSGREKFLQDSWGPLYVKRGGDWVFDDRGNPFVSAGKPFAVRKPAGVRRVVFIGESSGLFLAREFVEQYRRMAGAPVEAVNCAVGGASLELARYHFRRALDFDADAFVILLGNNIYYDQSPLGPATRRGTLRLLFASRLLGRLFQFSSSAGGLAELQAARLARLRGFVEEVRREAGRRGFRAFFCTVPCNLKYPPYFGPEDVWNETYLEAQRLRALGRHAEAADLLLSGPDAPALWVFEAADALERVGAVEQARVLYRRARDMDALRERAPGGLNDLVRGTADGEFIFALDLEKFVVERSPGEVPGWESFVDAQHLRAPLIKQEAFLCGKKLREIFPDFPIPREPPRAETAYSVRSFLKPAFAHHFGGGWSRAVVYALDHALQAGGEGVFGELEALRDDPLYLKAYERAADKARFEASFHLQCGEAFARRGLKAAARESLLRAERAFPGWEEIFLRKGFQELSFGEPARARAIFEGLRRRSRGQRAVAAFLAKWP